MNPRHLIRVCAAALAAVSLTGCITDDLQECPNDYELRLVFDRNMLFADAFASQVHSVDIKVFDSASGRKVYEHTESGGALAAAGYSVPLRVPPGSYDILCWAGMAEDDSFGYADPAAEYLNLHGVILNTDTDATSRRRLAPLFHGLARNVTFTDNNDTGSYDVQTATVSLTKDTNRVRVILLNLDGTAMTDGAFNVSVSSHNAAMAYDNTLGERRRVTYTPWHTAPVGAVTSDDSGDGSRADAVSAGLAAELSVARLTDTSDSRLDVTRVSDGTRIISVPLERNLLLYKGEFHAYMSDTEYLDRQDDYTITFILDSNNNWDKAAMIYINDWATPPVQYQEW